MTGKLSILIFLCKTNCGSIQYNSEGGRVSNKSQPVSLSCRKMSDFKNKLSRESNIHRSQELSHSLNKKYHYKPIILLHGLFTSLNRPIIQEKHWTEVSIVWTSQPNMNIKFAILFVRVGPMLTLSLGIMENCQT